MGDETILLVEDEAEVRYLVQVVLRRQGYTILEAGGGEEALRVAANHSGPISLLLTDIVMPGVNGVALAEQLTQVYPGLKALFMSGYTNEPIAHSAALDPSAPFLQKPFSPADLARKVREVLDV
jgi:DNA-binding NtrC family response regulator